jgi:hypothetical protein
LDARGLDARRIAVDTHATEQTWCSVLVTGFVALGDTLGRENRP